MKAIQQNVPEQRRVRPSSFWLLLTVSLAFGWLAQTRPAQAMKPMPGYVYGGFDNQTNGTNSENDGPVRMARFSYVSGDVSWRPDAQSDWSSAARNLPLRQGAQIRVEDGSRAEIQFDDGSRLRLGDNALITLQTLYSDADGEFTELTLTDGHAALRLKNAHSIYQVNTPVVSAKAVGPARFRVGAMDQTQIAVLQGHAEVEGPQGKTTLQSGDFLDLQDANSPYDIERLPAPGSFDTWSDARDRAMEGYGTRSAHRYLPPDIAIAGDDLDDYGNWHNDPSYGEVWVPHVASSTWRPYYDGHWVWVDPFGWTWVANEPWGWAPYHYGTWVHQPYGWAWAPGPRAQYWSPGVVSFTEYNGSVAWCPLRSA